MDVKRLPTKVLHCNLREKSNRDRQPKTWIDNIQEDLKIGNTDIRVAVEMTRDGRDREKWICIVQRHCQ